MPTPRHVARPKPEPVIFQIGGKDVPFQLGFNALVEIEERLDASITQIANGLQQPNAKTLRIIVAAGLSNKDEVYSDEEAGAAIAEHGMIPFMEAIGEFLNYAIGVSGDIVTPTREAFAERGREKVAQAARGK